jgi:acetyl esterase/lipase
MKAAALALALMGLALPAAAQAPTGPPAPPVLDTTLAFPKGVTLHGDVVYSSPRGYRPLTLDLYRPKAKGAVPLVIFVHGGAWAGGTSRAAEIIGDNFPNMFAALSAKGYAVASINYRLSSEAHFPAQVQDVNAAIRFLRTQPGIDGSRIVLWGASAGAHVSMLSALDCKTGAFETKPAGQGSTCVSAVVDWFGPITVTSATPSATSLAYIGCAPTACPDLWKKSDVLPALTADAPPFLIVHGDADTTVPIAQSRALLAALGSKAELKVVPKGNHLFRGADRPDIDAAIARTFAFIDEQTKARP